MKILAITPIHVGGDERRRRQARYDRLAPADVSIDLRDLPPAAPRSLESEADIRRSEKFVADAIATADLFGYDAVVPDCVLDPAVERLRHSSPAVLGILRTSVGALVGAGHVVGAVTRNGAIAAELADRLAVYGLDRDFIGVEVLDLDFEAIADGGAWNAALGAAVDRLREQGASAIVNGCSAVDVASAAPDVWVVDPTALALHVVSVLFGQSRAAA